jgi:uncharacterized protein YcfJ
MNGITPGFLTSFRRRFPVKYRQAIRMASLIALVLQVPLARAHYQWAEVVGVEPVYQQVAVNVPQQQCWNQQVPVTTTYYSEGNYRPRDNLTGILVGGLVGAAVGNHLGHGSSNRRIGAVAGGLLGASVANDVGRNNAVRQQSQTQWVNQQQCQMVDQVQYQQQVTGYRVSYVFNGRVLTAMMDRDPGPQVQVWVDVRPYY